jgi:glycosyltransferase involved in cell wall biosynthesis
MARRLLLATDSLEPSGVGEHMLALAQGLRDAFDIVLAAPEHASGDVPGRASQLGFRFEAIAGDGAVTIADGAFDIVHIHAGIGWEGHRLAKLAALAGIATIVRTEHLPYVLTDPEQQDEHRRGLDNVSGLICVSEASAASFVAAGVPGSLIDVVRNGVVAVPPRRNRRDIRRALGVVDDVPLAITVARMTAQKNLASLITSMPDILARHTGLRLALVGTGPLEAELRVAAAPLGEAVLFLGHRDDVPDLLAAADLFLLPSLFEGLPLVLIEAMAAGLPAVASAIGGSDEVVVHGETGLLTAPDRFADAVLHCLGDPVAMAAMAVAARRRFETLFSHSRMSRETHDVYMRLASMSAEIRMTA